MEEKRKENKRYENDKLENQKNRLTGAGPCAIIIHAVFCVFRHFCRKTSVYFCLIDLFHKNNGGFNMSTYMAKKGDLERKWYVLDAAGKPLGKTAGCRR